MSTLIVQAHPLRNSFNAALLDAVVAKIDSSSCAIVRVGQGDTLTRDSLAGVARLVMVYPTWWGSLPAMLLAQLEALLCPWVDGVEPATSSPLRSIEELTVVTSHGSSRFINRLQGQAGLHLWKQTVLPLCAPGARFEWKSLYSMDQITDSDRQAFLDQV